MYLSPEVKEPGSNELNAFLIKRILYYHHTFLKNKMMITCYILFMRTKIKREIILENIKLLLVRAVQFCIVNRFL